MSAERPPSLLNDSQRRVVATALTLLSFLGSIALLILAIIVLGQLAAFFSGVLWPLAVAGVLALLLRPLVARLEHRLNFRRTTSVVVLYGSVVIVTVGALALLLPPLITQLVDFVGYLPTLWEKASDYIAAHYPEWIALGKKQLENPSVKSIADSLMSESKALFSHAVPSLKAAFGGFLDLFAFLTHLAIIPVYLFFFLLMRGASTRHLGSHLPFLSESVRGDVVFLVREFVTIIESFFRGQLLIGLCMGVLLAAGFTIVGLKFGLFVGLVFGLLNIIPYLGTILGLAVTVPLAFFQPGGGWQLLGLVLLVKIIVQCVEGWFLTPRIMGHSTGLHPVVIIVAIFFWGTAFGGVLGMLLAVPLTAFFVTAWRLAKRKYFQAGEA
ncbi:MAG: AI-2E family transporter [Opitutaceae bacterium]|nr:AI-2E family transporter [Opitutaceae bacterium]